MIKKLLLPLFGALIVIAGTLLAIKFAQGYRPDLSNGGIKGTGLLVANSFPDGAQVFINHKLTTATDDTLNLSPGQYNIEIKKDGYTPWVKTLTLQEELVTQTNATLFPSVPTLKPLTFTGASNPTPSPDGQKLAFILQNAANPAKNGLYILEMGGTTFIKDKEPRQISRIFWSETSTSQDSPYNHPQLTWSPDSQQVLVSYQDENHLLDASRFNDSGSLTDASARLPVIFSEWEAELYRSELRRLLTLPSEMQQIATQSATNLYFSPDEQKLFYTASQAVAIPENLAPPLPAESTQPEQRQLEPLTTYVYDLKEDKNFKVLDPTPAELGQSLKEKIRLVDQIKDLPLIPQISSPSAHLKLQDNLDIVESLQALNAHYSPISIQSLQWFPTSNHLILTQENKISILEYDGTNLATIYANAFADNFVYPWPNGSSLVILTNLNQDSTLPPNLYSINLK